MGRNARSSEESTATVSPFSGSDLNAGFDSALARLKKRLDAELTKKINKINAEQLRRASTAFQDSQLVKLNKRRSNFLAIQGKLEANIKSVVDLKKMFNELKGFIRDTKTGEFNLKRNEIETKLDGFNHVVDGLVNTGQDLAELRRDGSLVLDAPGYNGFATQADRDAAAIDAAFAKLSTTDYFQRKNINLAKGAIKQLDGQVTRTEQEVAKIRLEEKQLGQAQIRKARLQNDATPHALENKIDSSYLTGMFFDLSA